MSQDKFADHVLPLRAAARQSPWSRRSVAEAAGSGVRDALGRRAPRRRPGLGPHGVQGLVKASVDRAVAALVLVLLAPVLVVVAVCVKATSPGPVFVRHWRVGRDGRVFSLLRFRTTALHAGERPVVDDEVLWALRRDVEETPLGAALRRYAIDELPQFINVLVGDMSLVGPPPGVPAGMTGLDDDVLRRSPVRPGLTGLVPVGGSRDRPWDDGRLAVEYAANWSLLLDLVILRKTVAAAVRGNGAT
jgi:lipopolysaccharide/colanic/teichoic acid biosynthesis glycosyltransferase